MPVTESPNLAEGEFQAHGWVISPTQVQPSVSCVTKSDVGEPVGDLKETVLGHYCLCMC